MTHFDITIGIPTYNGARFIGDAVASAAQLPYPIVVSDDGSIDGTPDIVETEFSKRVELHRPGRNGGIARKFQYLLQSCRTRSILLLNQDDLVDAGALQNVRLRPEGVTVLNGWVIDGTERRKRLIYRRPPAHALARGVSKALRVENFIRTPTQVMSPASVAREVGGSSSPGLEARAAKTGFAGSGWRPPASGFDC